MTAGVIAKNIGLYEYSMEKWQIILKCNPHYVTFVHQQEPESVELSNLAIEVQPNVAESWFWYGDTHTEIRKECYEIGLTLDPKDGKRWIVLGYMLEGINPEEAMKAFLQGCYNGDPGSNGCWNVGKLAEQLGNTDEAIQYYRRSNYWKAQQRADELLHGYHQEDIP